MDCHLLSHGISIEKDKINDCCLMRGEEYGRPFIIDIKNNSVNWKELFKRKRKWKSKKTEKQTDCQGCYNLREKEYDDGDYISFINFNHWNICNSKCIYCSKEYNGGDKYFNVLPIIKSLVDSGYFRNTGEITFQGGEPSILPEFEDLLELFIKENAKIRIHSSGIKFSNAVAAALSKGLVTIVISPDSGTAKTYKKIKTVPCFNTVWQNIKEYASVQKDSDRVKVKYIINPKINDNIEEIDAWLKKCKESKVNNIIIDVEGGFASWRKYKIPHYCMLIDYIVFKAEETGLQHEFYDSAVYCIKKRIIPETPYEILSDKFLFNEKYNQIKKIYKFENF